MRARRGTGGLIGWIFVSALAAFVGYRHHQGQLNEISSAERQGIPHSTVVSNWDLLLYVPAGIVGLYLLYELSKYLRFPGARAAPPIAAATVATAAGTPAISPPAAATIPSVEPPKPEHAKESANPFSAPKVNPFGPARSAASPEPLAAHAEPALTKRGLAQLEFPGARAAPPIAAATVATAASTRAISPPAAATIPLAEPPKPEHAKESANPFSAPKGNPFGPARSAASPEPLAAHAEPALTKRGLAQLEAMRLADRPREALDTLDRLMGFSGMSSAQKMAIVEAWPVSADMGDAFAAKAVIQRVREDGGTAIELTMDAPEAWPLKRLGNLGLREVFLLRSKCLADCFNFARHRFEGGFSLANEALRLVASRFEHDLDLVASTAQPFVMFNVEVAIMILKTNLKRDPAHPLTLEMIRLITLDYQQLLKPDHKTRQAWEAAFPPTRAASPADVRAVEPLRARVVAVLQRVHDENQTYFDDPDTDRLIRERAAAALAGIEAIRALAPAPPAVWLRAAFMKVAPLLPKDDREDKTAFMRRLVDQAFGDAAAELGIASPAVWP